MHCQSGRVGLTQKGKLALRIRSRYRASCVNLALHLGDQIIVCQNKLRTEANTNTLCDRSSRSKANRLCQPQSRIRQRVLHRIRLRRYQDEHPRLMSNRMANCAQYGQHAFSQGFPLITRHHAGWKSSTAQMTNHVRPILLKYSLQRQFVTTIAQDQFRRICTQLALEFPKHHGGSIQAKQSLRPQDIDLATECLTKRAPLDCTRRQNRDWQRSLSSAQVYRIDLYRVPSRPSRHCRQRSPRMRVTFLHWPVLWTQRRRGAEPRRSN